MLNIVSEYWQILELSSLNWTNGMLL